MLVFQGTWCFHLQGLKEHVEDVVRVYMQIARDVSRIHGRRCDATVNRKCKKSCCFQGPQ
jgi:hypothetical protein